MTSFDLENVNPRSRNSHQKEFLCGSTHPQVWFFYSFSGSRDSRGHYMPPPPPGRLILRPSPARVLRSLFPFPVIRHVCLVPFPLSQVTPARSPPDRRCSASANDRQSHCQTNYAAGPHPMAWLCRKWRERLGVSCNTMAQHRRQNGARDLCDVTMREVISLWQ